MVVQYLHDNSLPHIKSNVEPCCLKCNLKLVTEEFKEKFSKKVYQYTLDNKLVKIWNSVSECAKGGFNIGAVAACCRGGYYSRGSWINITQHKGYKWSYNPL